MFGDLISIRVRLLGAREGAAEAQALSTSIEESAAATTAANEKTAASSKAAAASAMASTRRQISAMRTVGRGLTTWITAPLAAIAIGSGVMAAHFDRSMNLLATDAGGTAKEVGHLKGQVLDLARESQFGPQKLADAMFHVESSGYRGAKAIRVLNEAQKLATAGNSELEQTTYALVSAQKALHEGESLKGITKTAAQLNEIVSHGDIRLEELTSAMATGLLPTSKALGLSVADVGSALDVMTKRGMPAQRSAYALNFTLQKLVPSTEKAEDAFAALGLKEEQLLKTAQTKGLPAAFGLLHDKLAHLTKGGEVKMIDEMFGGGRMSKGLLVVLQHVGEMRELWSEVDGNIGLYKKHVHEAEEQPLVKAKKAWSDVEASLVEIGQVLLPAAIPLLEGFAHGAEGIAHAFTGLPGPLQTTVLGLAGLFALAGPALLFASAMGKAAMSLGLLQATEGGGVGINAARAGMIGKMGLFGLAGTAAVVGGQAIGGTTGNLISGIGGGAAAGAMLGSVVPVIGTGVGAAVGAGLGALPTLIPAVASLFSSEKRLGPLQQKLVYSGREMRMAMSRQSDASHGLAAANRKLDGAQNRAKTSTERLKSARKHLQDVISQYGAHSRPAIRAEANLTLKIDGHRKALKRLENQERLHGVALSAYKTATDFSIIVERHRINVLKDQAQHLREAFLAQNKINPASERTHELASSLLDVEGELSHAVKHKAEVEQEAAQKGGAKYAHFLQHATQEQLRFSNATKAAKNHVEELAGAQERQAELAPGAGFGGEISPEHPFGIPQTHPKHGHHRKTGAHERPGATSRLLNRAAPPPPPQDMTTGLRGGRGRLKAEVKVPFVVDRRKLTEAVISVQHDDEARE